MNTTARPGHSRPRLGARLLAAAAAAPVALTALVTPASAATLGTDYAHSAYGYPYPNAPKCTGGGACVPDQWNFYQGQCVSWVAFRLNAVNGVAMNNSYKGIHWGSAANWASAARAVGIPVDQRPAAGAVAWFSYGHVAYVERVNADGSIVLSELNFVAPNGFDTVVTRPGDSRWPSAFIHVQDTQVQAASLMAPSTGFRVSGDQLVQSGRVIASGWSSMRLVTTVPDVTGDGRPDLLAATGDGTLWFYPSTRTGLGVRHAVGRGWDGVGAVTASGTRIVAVTFSGQRLAYTVMRPGLLG